MDETQLESNMLRIVTNENYKAIIYLGQGVVPILLNEMKHQPHWWHAALHELTGANPVLPEHRGKIRDIADDWVRWGAKNGY